MMRGNGYATGKSGAKGGEGLYFHTKAAMDLLWPEDDWHRWAELALKAIIENEVVVFLGCSDSGKTWMMAKWAMVDWWASPDKTLTLVSSTEIRGAELRIWGTIKEFFNRGKERFPWLPGRSLESMHTITLQEIDEETELARSLKSGLILVPCISGGKYVGLGKFIGMKAPKGGKLRHIGDETGAMQISFLDAYSNWIGKENFKGLMAANPLDPEGPEGIASQPIDGWPTFVDTEKTQMWRSKFYNALVVNFDGRDSPNLDYSATEPVKYSYLIGRKKLETEAKTHGKDSWHFFWQCCGKMKPGMMLNRVISREICIRHHALETTDWDDDRSTKIYPVDPAYGGGDRCVGGVIEFRRNLDGQEILRVGQPELIPINLKLDVPPEDQIAGYVKSRLTQLHIPVNHCGYDSFGRGTLGFSFAKMFGADTPVPIDAGARPTKRPVRFDLFIDDPTTGQKRLKRCDEHYSKFITEMWFSVREAIESEQMRELPEDVMAEGCLREYSIVQGNKIEVESKKDLKDRVGKSPDLFDWLAIGVEMARRLGFQIKRIGSNVESEEAETEDEESDYLYVIKTKLLEHA